MSFRAAILIGIFVAALSRLAMGFPQMVAHGYPSCTACHYSPYGGGLMTPYGRSLSREALSQTGFEGEENFLYGALKNPDWLQLGGDVRVLQNYMSTPMMEMSRLLVMQADLEVGLVFERARFIGTFGYQNAMSANFSRSPVMSRRHYFQVLLSEQDSVRAGRFDVAYGIHWPDHFLFSKRDLGWDEGSEAYQLEYAHIAESWETIASLSIGRPDDPQSTSEQGLNLKGAVSFKEKNQIGLHAYYGSSSRGSRALVGPTAAITPFDHFTVFAEFDVQKMLGGARGTGIGFVETLRLNYEAFKGLHVYVMQEYERLDLSRIDRSKQAYTVGTQWFFRPHVEVAGGWRRQKGLPVADVFYDSAWLVLHYYL